MSLTQEIASRVGARGYELFDHVESKSSEYFYLWPTKWGEKPETATEDDMPKMRLSSHNAICSRSKSWVELEVNATESGAYITFNVDYDLDEMDDDEITEVMNDYFGMDMSGYNYTFNGWEAEIKIGWGDKNYDRIIATIMVANLRSM